MNQRYGFYLCVQTRKLSNSSKSWINRHVNDAYVKQAVREDMRSRSAYKLVEIQGKHKIIKPKDFVVDLGAAPGVTILFSIFSISDDKCVFDYFQAVGVWQWQTY